MATFAPNSANFTAIAWPMPDVPPVTSTPLPFKPGIASRRAGAVAVVDICPSSSSVSSRFGSPSRRGVTPNERGPLDQLELAGSSDGLLAAGCPELAEDAARVRFDRVEREVQLRSDLTLRQ